MRGQCGAIRWPLIGILLATSSLQHLSSHLVDSWEAPVSRLLSDDGTVAFPKPSGSLASSSFRPVFGGLFVSDPPTQAFAPRSDLVEKPSPERGPIHMVCRDPSCNI
ncbi:hypothetical protein LZ30DRAFT_394755 [Colletotrichum cereale]|nr:hypothetical protein LZ30DRAFT_394755 [Colletotrichum cereale]